MKPERVRLLKIGRKRNGPVVYWMSRDQRLRDNWALIFAQDMAVRASAPLAVAFTLAPTFLGAIRRQYHFMLHGLKELEASLSGLGIPFFLLKGEPAMEIVTFTEACGAAALVMDFDPLRPKRAWKEEALAGLGINAYEVDAHNVVPCWAASPKQEWGAYTLRPKLHRYLPVYFEDFPEVVRHPIPWRGEGSDFSVGGAMEWLKPDQEVREADWIEPGEKAAGAMLESFMAQRLDRYATTRNDPMADGQSNLSPYLHFGQISAQRVALRVIGCRCHKPSADAFLEELLVRRELADNFCLYNRDYDRFEGFPAWARSTLEAHRRDRREYLYTCAELEGARTHDELWNAAQLQMVRTGKMHGYMRMYWAKKILEWTESPEEALRIAILLNDRYELDGRDSNGYAGIAWSLGGVHDRAWGERPVFGKVRYMGRRGVDSKFPTGEYIRKYSSR